MYKALTFNEILQRMLDRVPSKYDKREGSIIWDSTAPAAVELFNAYILLQGVLMEMFPDTATRKYLIKHCAERGITPKPASPATVEGEFTPTNLEIPIGARFSHEDLNYKVTKKIEDGLYELECETLGTIANGVTGRLIPIDYVDGLETANIIDMIIPGEAEESTESLRVRYFASINSETFGGNKLDYEQKILSISGVGQVKVYSGAEWNGGGTVRCVIVDSDDHVPTEGLVDDVQTIIDPCILPKTSIEEENKYIDENGIEREYEYGHSPEYTAGGEGNGIAPIGHFVTIVGAYNTVINITCSMTYKSGYTWDKVKDNVKTAIDNYLASLNEKWSGLDKIRVRIAHIENAILNVEGILDIQNTSINGKEENLAVDKDSLVSRGTINGD